MMTGMPLMMTLVAIHVSGMNVVMMANVISIVLLALILTARLAVIAIRMLVLHHYNDMTISQHARHNADLQQLPLDDTDDDQDDDQGDDFRQQITIRVAMGPSIQEKSVMVDHTVLIVRI